MGMCTIFGDENVEEEDQGIQEGDEVDFAPPIRVWDGSTNHPLRHFAGVHKCEPCKVVSAPEDGGVFVKFCGRDVPV
ncbi:MAG TPA: hypothetical protein VHB93_00815, partial [Candidatus Paceibacterota bacterium]|nr:hypothetical protein [Candidatus Paceibacterota bacterium]